MGLELIFAFRELLSLNCAYSGPDSGQTAPASAATVENTETRRKSQAISMFLIRCLIVSRPHHALFAQVGYGKLVGLNWIGTGSEANSNPLAEDTDGDWSIVGQFARPAGPTRN